GTGPIEALHAQERRLDAIEGIHLLHLRPGSFMENLLAGLHEVAATGSLSGMEPADVPIPMVATRSIATVAAQELVSPRRSGALILHAPRHITMREAAQALGAAIGKPGPQYLRSAAAEVKAQLRSLGFSASAADQLEA